MPTMETTTLLRHMLKTTSLLSLFEIGDHAIVDRGFRDVIDEVDDYAIHTHMPELKSKNEKQFSALKGNKSRKVTIIRWVIEAANGRIKKKFKFFDLVVQNTYIPKLGRLFRVACAFINAFLPPLFSESEATAEIVHAVVANEDMDNAFRVWLESEKLLGSRMQSSSWIEASNDCIPTFPHFSEDDIKKNHFGNISTKDGSALYRATQPQSPTV